MPVRSPAPRRGRWVPGVNVCAPWRLACISWAALSSARPSSVVRYITCLLLLVSPPPVSAPATNRARTLRKGISSVETGIAAVRQAYDGRSVRPRCCVLRSRFGRVGLGLHPFTPSLRCGSLSSGSEANPCGCIVSLAYGKVRLLLTGTRFAEGYAPDLRHRLMWARMLRLASHLTRPQLLRRPDQDDLLLSAWSGVLSCFTS